jgi:flagellar hook-associated protein 2
MSEKKVASPTSNFDAGQGALFGDSGLSSMLSKMRMQMGEAYTGLGNAATLDDLTDIGISSGKIGSTAAQAKSGLLRIDDTKLADAIANDSQAVRRLFGGGSDSALAQDVEQLVDDLSETIDARVATIDRQDRRITDDLAKAELRLDAREKRLKAQFAAMETALNAAQTQQSWLTGQLDALNARSS